MSQCSPRHFDEFQINLMRIPYFSMAEKIKAQIAQGLYADATNSWSTLEGLIISSSNSVVSNLSLFS